MRTQKRVLRVVLETSNCLGLDGLRYDIEKFLWRYKKILQHPRNVMWHSGS